jgi:hypothetical protein
MEVGFDFNRGLGDAGLKAFGACELVRNDATVDVSIQNAGLPPVGLEPTTR